MGEQLHAVFGVDFRAAGEIGDDAGWAVVVDPFSRFGRIFDGGDACCRFEVFEITVAYCVDDFGFRHSGVGCEL